MSILIRGMEMPKENEVICVFPNGIVQKRVIKWSTLYEVLERSNAVPVPPHGDLIDRDGIEWIEEEFEERCHNDRWTVVEKIAYKAQVDKLPTIIKAEEGET